MIEDTDYITLDINLNISNNESSLFFSGFTRFWSKYRKIYLRGVQAKVIALNFSTASSKYEDG